MYVVTNVSMSNEHFENEMDRSIECVLVTQVNMHTNTRSPPQNMYKVDSNSAWKDQRPKKFMLNLMFNIYSMRKYINT